MIFLISVLSTGQQIALTPETVKKFKFHEKYYFDYFIAEKMFSNSRSIGPVDSENHSMVQQGQIDLFENLPVYNLLGGEIYLVEEGNCAVAFWRGIWFELDFDWTDYADDLRNELEFNEQTTDHVIHCD